MAFYPRVGGNTYLEGVARISMKLMKLRLSEMGSGEPSNCGGTASDTINTGDVISNARLSNAALFLRESHSWNAWLPWPSIIHYFWIFLGLISIIIGLSPLKVNVYASKLEWQHLQCFTTSGPIGRRTSQELCEEREGEERERRKEREETGDAFKLGPPTVS